MSYSENTKESTIRTYKTTQQSYNQGEKKILFIIETKLQDC